MTLSERELTPGCRVVSETSNMDMLTKTHLSGDTSRDDDNLGSFKSFVKLVGCVAFNLARGHKLKLRRE